MEVKIEALSRALRVRGIDEEEIATICGFVDYIDRVEAIDESFLDANLPLAYEPQAADDGERRS